MNMEVLNIGTKLFKFDLVQFLRCLDRFELNVTGLQFYIKMN